MKYILLLILSFSLAGEVTFINNQNIQTTAIIHNDLKYDSDIEIVIYNGRKIKLDDGEYSLTVYNPITNSPRVNSRRIYSSYEVKGNTLVVKETTRCPLSYNSNFTVDSKTKVRYMVPTGFIEDSITTNIIPLTKEQ